MDVILDGTKDFKNEGAGITTNGISALVHFIVPKSCNDDKHNEMTNLMNIEQLSLTPIDCNDQYKSDNVDEGTWEDIPNEGAFYFTVIKLLSLLY